jgi:hypothetical protein
MLEGGVHQPGSPAQLKTFKELKTQGFTGWCVPGPQFNLGRKPEMAVRKAFAFLGKDLSKVTEPVHVCCRSGSRSSWSCLSSHQGDNRHLPNQECTNFLEMALTSPAFSVSPHGSDRPHVQPNQATQQESRQCLTPARSPSLSPLFPLPNA